LAVPAVTLRSLTLKDVALAPLLHAEFGSRLNVITGDNGLGKSLLLDAAWWALTGAWAGAPIVGKAGRGDAPAVEIDAHQVRGVYQTPSERKPPMGGRYSPSSQSWTYWSDGWTDAAVLYLQVDGSFALWDAARHARAGFGGASTRTIARAPGQRFTHDALWNGLKEGDRVVCRGLVDDWVTWQLQRDRDPQKRFEALSSVLALLSPHPGEWMRPGEPQRVFVDDARDFPTVETPYGTVPAIHASAAMKRILGFAYLLVWAWNEHREASRLRGMPPTKRLVVLADEVETHLHPQWQRRIMPSLLQVAGLLDPALEVQFLVTTHSPLVLASLEPVFDPERDKLFLLALDAARTVALGEVPWAKRGDAQRWLTSEVFGLEQTRSLEAEAAVEAAQAWMRNEREGLPAGLDSAEAIDARLRALLPAQDPFWPRWIVQQEGGE